MRESIILIGAGGHARSCIDVIEQTGRYHILGLIGFPEQVGLEILGYPIIGSDDDLGTLMNEEVSFLNALGQIKTPAHRIEIFNRIKQQQGILPAIISPRAYVSVHAVVGEGTIIMHGAVVNAGARIGENCIINTNALIEHDVEVDDHCHISTSSTLNGGVKIRQGTFIGSGSMIRESVMIGENCVIGMGQNVLKDCGNGYWLSARESKYENVDHC